MALLSSQFGAEQLAAQTVLMSLIAGLVQVPYGVAAAAGTRMSNLIGAGMASQAKLTMFIVRLEFSPKKLARFLRSERLLRKEPCF